MTKAQRRRAQEEIMLALANRLHVMKETNADPVQVRAFLEETWKVGKLFGFTSAYGIGPIN